MNHDLIHCDGLDCPLRENCMRYKAHLDLKENQYNGLYDYYVINPYDRKTKSCKQIKTE